MSLLMFIRCCLEMFLNNIAIIHNSIAIKKPLSTDFYELLNYPALY